jgi:ribonuclease BN (tRNA processing enzyme)
MKIRLLGAHNCETRDYRHTCMVIDDVLALDAGSLTASLTMEQQMKLGAVLLSHQHYDHIRDVVALGTNLFHGGTGTDIYTTSFVAETLDTHFFSSGMYRNLAAVPEGNPTLRVHVIEPDTPFTAGSCRIEAFAVNHSAYTVGYAVTSEDGIQVLYTSDTGPGLAEVWKKVKPQLLIIEVTETSESSDFFRKAGHLTPLLLEEELLSFQAIQHYLPDVITVHMSPRMEAAISRELRDVAGRLGCWITPGFEGMEIEL